MRNHPSQGGLDPMRPIGPALIREDSVRAKPGKPISTKQSRPKKNRPNQRTGISGLPELIRQFSESVTMDVDIAHRFKSLRALLANESQIDLSKPVRGWRDMTNRLEDMMSAYKRAQFDDALRTAAKSMRSFLQKNSKETTPEYWKARTLIYELNDFFHIDDEIGSETLALGNRVQSELHNLFVEGSAITDRTRLLIREQVLYCACRGNELKRAGDPESALKLFRWLLDFTQNRVVSEKLPCFSTLATLSYHLGSIYRVLEQHARAEDMYTQSLTYLYQRSKTRDTADLDDHFFTIRKQAMAIGIGVGWVNLTRGQLRRAEHALTTARSLLAHSQDTIIPSYIEMLYGTIKRCRAGADGPKLREAIRSLTEARATFERHGHSRYVPRACWELSLALVQAGRFEAAGEAVQRVAEYADRIGHPKWQTNVHILQSRIARNQGDHERAIREARKALLRADDCSSILPLIDARLTLGEAELCIAQKSDAAKPDYTAALSEFENALELAGGDNAHHLLPSNPKIVAVCFLRIAQCFARQEDEVKAKDWFARWEALRHQVEHEWVRDLADEVQAEIDGLLRNFFLSATNRKEWDYSRSVARLKRWLLTQALRHTGNNFSEAAKIIGVKRATLYDWLKNNGRDIRRARTKNVKRRHKHPG